MAPRDAFPGYDEPVNIDMDPEDAVRLLIDADADAEDSVEDGAETEAD